MQETKGKAGIGVRYLGGVFFLGLGVLFLIWGLIQFPIASGGVAMILMAIGLFFVGSALLLFGYNDHKRVRQGGRSLNKDWGGILNKDVIWPGAMCRHDLRRCDRFITRNVRQ